MRFLADENVSRLVVERLRSHGFDVADVARGQKGAPDPDVLAAAHAGNLVLITEDTDFGELVIRKRPAVRGVILPELDRLSNFAEAVRVADVVLSQADKLEGNLVVIEPTRVRVRPLPTAAGS